MNSIEIEAIRTALDWTGRGQHAILATVVRTWGSAPRPPGSLMVIRGDGQVAGSVSGGCIEDDLVRRICAGELVLKQPEFTVYGETAEESRRFGLPCGGSVQIVLEPLSEQSRLRELLVGIEQRRRVERRLDLHSGQVQLGFDAMSDGVRLDGGFLVTTHGPRYRLLIVGGGQLSHYLAQMAVMLDHQVTVCEPRSEYWEAWSQASEVPLSRQMPDDQVISMEFDCNSAVVALTHDPKLDDLALMEALRTPAYYVGALGSRRNNEGRRSRLLEFDLDREAVARLRGPVGLNLGALTPPEIALSILCEMTATLRGMGPTASLRDWTKSSRSCALAVKAQ